MRGSQHQLRFFEALQKLLPGERVVYHDWKTLPGFELDIVLPDRRVVVEVDGVFFNDKPGQRERDAQKDRLLAERGWRVYRVRDDGLSFAALEAEARELVETLVSKLP